MLRHSCGLCRTSILLPSRAIWFVREDDPLDDIMSLVASDTEDWAGLMNDPAPLPYLEPIDARAGMDTELLHVLSKAVEELGLEWSLPEEPKVAHPLKPCRTTSALAGCAYTSAGQAASVLHTMAILQVFQAKLLCSMDKSGPDPAVFREVRSVNNLALRATK
ncbi:hypothetical protein DPX16_11603 [Anabarilius grahami]|uniref:Uncharacterized protein n=1 Tax=Anabarilius grahami TaxID=495550 RepID=A0A3N0YJE1_ANAGA|nr:hypothetical protein DPX16_11603 [Anabarilius grahami]